MSFESFASGSRGFHYNRKKCMDGDDFNSLKLMASLLSIKPTAEDVASAAAEKLLSKVPQADITDAVGGVARTEFFHLLKTSIDLLAMQVTEGEFKLNVAGSESKIFWVDSKSFAQYRFLPGDDPGTEFFRLIYKGLEETNLNTWGVLRELMVIIVKFTDHLGDEHVGENGYLNIFLSH